jgi:acyl-CoA synthetase (AMP-forming)/AMP-acid ligase II
VRPGDRIASFAWNTHRHLELYYAVPMLGAVLHTINIRLFRFVFADASLEPALARAVALGGDAPKVVVLDERYEALLADKPTAFDWPDVGERAGASLCYTSATTGDPKGVLYTHRSQVLHALGAGLACSFGASERDCVLPVVPMFHANVWAVPYLVPVVGAKLVLPGNRLDGASAIELAEREAVTLGLGVPTVWLGLRDELEKRDTRLTTFKRVVIGGSAVPPSLFDDLGKRGIEVIHAWGMTEMSPLGTTAFVVGDLADASPAVKREKLLKQGIFSPLVAWKLLDNDGHDVPRDGRTPGNLWVRGPAVTGSYYRGGGDKRVFRDGYLLTGDVCTVDEHGYLELVDRLADLVKSGGEWISSVALENAIMGHPGVREAAVVGVPHSKWSERPIAVVVARDEQPLDEQTLKAWLEGRVAKWRIPDRVVFADAIPRSGVGKFLNRVLRERYHDILLA